MDLEYVQFIRKNHHRTRGFFFLKGRKGLPSIKRNRAKFKNLTDRLYSLLYMAEERTAD